MVEAVTDTYATEFAEAQIARVQHIIDETFDELQADLSRETLAKGVNKALGSVIVNLMIEVLKRQ